MQVENYKKDDNNNGGVAGHEVEAIKADRGAGSWLWITIYFFRNI